jgi:hypothetical protein
VLILVVPGCFGCVGGGFLFACPAALAIILTTTKMIAKMIGR